MAQKQDAVVISDEERVADSRADAMAAVLLVAIAVATVIFWISGH